MSESSKAQRKLNMQSLKKDLKKMWPLLLGNIIFFVMTSMAANVIWAEFYEIVPIRLINLQTGIGWGMGILLGFIWARFSKRLLRFLIPWHMAWIVFAVIYLIFAETNDNMFIYWAIGFFQYTFIGVVCDKLYECAEAWFFKKSEERASFDNLEAMAICISNCLGSLIGVIYVPSLKVAIVLDIVSNAIWSVLVLYFVFPIRNRLKNPDSFDQEQIAEQTDSSVEAMDDKSDQE